MRFGRFLKYVQGITILKDQSIIKKRNPYNVNNVTVLVAYFFLVQKNQLPLIACLVCCLRLGLQSNYFVHCSKVRSLIFLQCILALNCTLLARELSHNYIIFLKVCLGIWRQYCLVRQFCWTACSHFIS